MAETSKIEWTDATWNPTRGCSKIAAGCAHCYAETFAERFRGVKGHPYEQGFDPRIAPEKLLEPLRWKKPRRIFVDSMSDLFHESFPDRYIAAVFGVMSACAERGLGHTFQLLTKRPAAALSWFRWFESQRIPQSVLHEAVKSYVGYDEPHRPAVNLAAGWPLPNVWIGTSIANQHDADANIPILLQIPAAIRFLSVEPLLGPIDLSPWFDNIAVSNHGDWMRINDLPQAIHWVIVGGESGPKARPCNVEWSRSIVRQCKAASVPVFVKQLGAHVRGSHDGFLVDRYEMPDGSWIRLPVIVVPAAEKRVAAALEMAVGFSLFDRKGGDWSEWPEDLRVREFPEVAA